MAPKDEVTITKSIALKTPNTVHSTQENVHNVPQVQVDGADVRDKLLGLEVKLTEVLHFKSTHFGSYQVLQEVVEHGDDPLSQERVHKDPFDF